MNEVEFTILMPCLNEEKTIGYCIREAKSAIRHYGISAEILIADNGSSDASKEIAKKNGAKQALLRRGGEMGIRTPEAALTAYTISSRAPSTSSDISP